MAEKIFWKNLGRSRKSIQFGKLDQKSLFFVWFFAFRRAQINQSARGTMLAALAGPRGIPLSCQRHGGGYRLYIVLTPGPWPSWPHSDPIFPYFFIGFLTIIYKKPYKKQWFLIQFAKLDRFPVSTQIFSKNLFGHFRPFFPIILFFWPFQIEVPQGAADSWIMGRSTFQWFHCLSDCDTYLDWAHLNWVT